jgi:hypothetical protein
MNDQYKTSAASLFATAARSLPTCQVIIDGQARCTNPAAYRQSVQDGEVVYEVYICTDCLCKLQQPVNCPHCFSEDTKLVENEYGLFRCCQCEEIFTRRTEKEQALWES